MQKKIIALALAAMAGSAFAQSNVTIYGVVDAGVARMSATGLKSQYAVESGMLGGSRIGFKGVEDLGNGLKALFTLEYALAVDDNNGVGAKDAAGTFSAADLWSGTVARQQLVGLTGGFGTAVVGRLQTAGYDWACAYNPIAGSALDTVGKLKAATLLQCGSGGRADNALAYISPSFGGVTVALNHARVTEAAAYNIYKKADPTQGYLVDANGNQIGVAKDNTANLVSVKYDNGPLSASAIYSRISMAGTSVSDDVSEYGLGASYDLKVAKLFGTFQAQKNNASGSGRDKKYSFAVAAPVSAAGTVVASYARNKLNNNSVSSDGSSAYNLSYLHALSKRTTAYAGYTRVTNQSNGDAGVVGAYNPNGAYVAATAAAPATGGDGNASVLGLGINHKF